MRDWLRDLGVMLFAVTLACLGGLFIWVYLPAMAWVAEHIGFIPVVIINTVWCLAVLTWVLDKPRMWDDD